MISLENKNIKLYPIYKATSWDLLFYYTILFLFLTQAKNISPADVLLAEAFYPIFKCIFLIPTTILIEKIGKRKGLILGNLINVFAIFTFIISSNLFLVIIAELLEAIAFNIKGIAETNLLYDSLPKDEKRGSRFSRIDGQGGAWYYYIDAITSVITGFLYIINPYIPMILCMITCVFSTFLSYKFVETKELKKTKISTKTYIKNLKSSFKYMFQSERLRYLMLFGAICSGLLSVLISLRSGTLEEIGVPEQYFGVIFGVLGMIAGIASKNQHRFHKHFRNKTLAMISVPAAVSAILVGLTVALKLPYTMTLVILLLLFAIQFISKGPFYTLIKRYLNNFTTSTLRSKISSCYNLMESLSRSIISLLASFLLRGIDSASTMCIIGCILTIILVLLLDKMRQKVGLKPEKYKKSEIEFLEIK